MITDSDQPQEIFIGADGHFFMGILVSSVGPQTPVEQHIAGSKISIFIVKLLKFILFQLVAAGSYSHGIRAEPGSDLLSSRPAGSIPALRRSAWSDIAS